MIKGPIVLDVIVRSDPIAGSVISVHLDNYRSKFVKARFALSNHYKQCSPSCFSVLIAFIYPVNAQS